jgi:ferritin-like metal-binding protein YciE
MMSPVQRVFVLLLSNARHSTERTRRFYEEISRYAPYADIKADLQARAVIANNTLATLDECFRLMGAEPMRARVRMEEVFADGFRRELIEIQSPTATALYILAKATHLQNLRIGEYVALAATAEVTGHPEIAALLKRCLADCITLVDRTKGMIRDAVADRITQKIPA